MCSDGPRLTYAVLSDDPVRILKGIYVVFARCLFSSTQRLAADHLSLASVGEKECGARAVCVLYLRDFNDVNMDDRRSALDISGAMEVPRLKYSRGICLECKCCQSCN
jgi:hypothetical protein